MRKAWTEKDLARLRLLVDGGMGFDAIAIEFGRSSGAVRVAHFRICGPKSTQRGWTAREREHLRALYANAVPLAIIARKLKRTWRSVAAAAVRFGLPAHPGQKRRGVPANTSRIATEVWDEARHARVLRGDPDRHRGVDE